MPKNKINDLNDHLFSQLERLSDEDLTGEKLQQEIQRAKAISEVASNIIGAAKVSVDAMKVIKNPVVHEGYMPEIFKQKQIQQ